MRTCFGAEYETSCSESPSNQPLALFMVVFFHLGIVAAGLAVGLAVGLTLMVNGCWIIGASSSGTSSIITPLGSELARGWLLW